ncbi:multicopper oxidase domain-containing protein [Bradyrhizobium sp.]|uniref:multicopper oxidase family protein n=1 Tax=Bradyrhizobium sp. TaxID=376 RepID=UPI002639EAA1|nr:multicopper oxidase domain-containing protein [Bradyrhizobium sp.]
MIAGLGAALVVPALPSRTAASGQPVLALRAKAGAVSLRPGQPATPISSLVTTPGYAPLRLKRGDALEVQLENETAAPIALNLHGIDGVPASEPLLARAPLAANAKDSFTIPLRHAGTFMCDVKLFNDGQALPSSGRALIVGESEMVAVDRDEVLLFEDWRLRPDGTAIAPGSDPGGTTPFRSVNGQLTSEILTRLHERLRLRLINGFQRSVIAVKIENHDVQVMALDGQPAEPFPARNGAVVLAPGARADVFIDATLPAGAVASVLLHDGTEARPIARLVGSKEPPLRTAQLVAAPALPSNALPAQLDLKGAMRVDLPLNGTPSSWVVPETFSASVPPAFHAKAGRSVVLTLTNRAATATIFHLHGHHFRLLDRLDDGWKPFWLDTLGVEPGQTQLIAFAADYSGRWLMEATATYWAAPRRLQWYSVG